MEIEFFNGRMVPSVVRRDDGTTIPFRSQPAIRGPIMLRLPGHIGPVSSLDLCGPLPGPGKHRVPVNRNYRKLGPMELVSIEQLHDEYLDHGGSGRRGNIPLMHLKAIRNHLQSGLPVPIVSELTGYSRSWVGQIKSGKAYWYIWESTDVQ